MAENSDSIDTSMLDVQVIEKIKSIEKNLEEMEKEVLNLPPSSPQIASSLKGNSLIMRHLLLLFKGQNMKKYRNIISNQLSFIICQNNGLLSFIRATCDFDTSSEKKTTFDQKFQALSTIITQMPQLHCSLEDYYKSLGPQIIKMLTTLQSKSNSVDRNKWKLIAYIANGFYEKNAQLTQKYIISPIILPLTQKNAELTIAQSLLAIYRLIVTHFSKTHFIDVFPNLFYISVHLDQKASPLKSMINEIVIDLLNSIEYSLYLIDYSLFNCFSIYDLYTLSTQEEVADQQVITIELKSSDEPHNLVPELEKIDQIVQVTVKLIDQLSDSKKVDLFLVFLEKLSCFSSKHLLLAFSLVDTLQNQVFHLILNYPSKAIQFLTTNLKRLSCSVEDTIQHKIDTEDIGGQESDETKSEASLVQQDSLLIILQIFGILLEERDKLSKEDIIGLKECEMTLEAILKLKLIDDVTRLTIESLSKEIKNLTIGKSKKSNCHVNEFEEAILGLNSKFMPTRAHSLITLKRLIDQNDPSAIKNRNQVLTLLKASLSDPESYVYLHSINALSSLALADTDNVLVVLIEAFHDKTRTIEERVNVGQVLVQLNRYIGDMAHHYSKKLIDCFLRATQDEDVSIRVSSISNLGQLCMVLRYALSYYIVEVVHAIQCLIQTDPEMSVKTACVMFIYMLMSGLDKNTFQTIQNEMKTIYKLIKNLDSVCLGDDVLRIYAHLALTEIDQRVKELFKLSTPKIIEID